MTRGLQQILFFISIIFVLFNMGSKSSAGERQLTHAAHGHILTNTAVWSPDSKWIVYDVRSDAAGDKFDGTRIERVNVETRQVEVLYESKHGARGGVATYSSTRDRVVFIHGPENPNEDWLYAAHHRRGVTVDCDTPNVAANLDARNIVAPYTPGALRGGTHVHTFSGDGQWVAFTYEDHVLAADLPNADFNQRNVGVSVPVRSVSVPKTHARNHDGSHFSVLVTRTANVPTPGSDQISKAFSDAWIGANGYLREDGTRQKKAIAFQGHVVTENGDTISETFIVDIPNDVTVPPTDGPLEGTSTRRPLPPRGTVQRRLTFTANRKFPGIQGVRHWLRSSPDGSHIAFLMKDDSGVVQMWTVAPTGGAPVQITFNHHDISSAFSWASNGRYVSHSMDESICVSDIVGKTTTRLTNRDPSRPIRPEACVFSPDGKQIAYIRRITSENATWNQVFVVDLE